MGNLVLYPHMHDFAYGDRRMHMGIPVCKRAGIAENFAYGDPITHNEIVRIRGLTYISHFSDGVLFSYSTVYKKNGH
jgi:hypothetical protein